MINDIFTETSGGTQIRLLVLDELVAFAQMRHDNPVDSNYGREDQTVNNARRLMIDCTSDQETDDRVFSNVVYILTQAPFKNEETTQYLKEKKSWYDRNQKYERDRIIGAALSGTLTPIDPRGL